jgi:hypothetical protein
MQISAKMVAKHIASMYFLNMQDGSLGRNKQYFS